MKLPYPGNSIHNALRSESLSPEREKWLEAEMLAEWAVKRSNCTETSGRQFGHSSFRLLYAVYISVISLPFR